MKKERKIDAQKSAIKKVVESGNQEIEKHVTKKRERGITLIALVVTIIIMLILAAVTLNMALGDNGLIQMAKFATNKYEQAAINESLAMQKLANDLNNPWSVAPTTTTTQPPTTTTPSGGGGTTEGQLTADNLNESNYGDYVDYKLDLNGDNDTTNDWRIFYVGDVPKREGDGAEEGETEKRVFLIAADYVPNECNALKEAQKKEHAYMSKSTYTDYSFCNSYWPDVSSVEYHCNDGHNTRLNTGKNQCSFPEIFMTTGNYCDSEHHYYCSDHVGETGKEGNINSRCASSLQCTGNWKSFVVSDYADYAIGGPTLEMWVASWNEKHGTHAEEKGKTLYADGTGDEDNNSGYYVGESKDCISTDCSVSSTPGYSDTLYFPHKTSTGLDLFNLDGSPEEASEGDSGTSENASCRGYWLSSPSANGANYFMQVWYDGGVYGDSYGINYFGVRPVVSLKSNVKLTKKSGEDGRVVYNISM